MRQFAKLRPRCEPCGGSIPSLSAMEWIRLDQEHRWSRCNSAKVAIVGSSPTHSANNIGARPARRGARFENVYNSNAVVWVRVPGVPPLRRGVLEARQALTLKGRVRFSPPLPMCP